MSVTQAKNGQSRRQDGLVKRRSLVGVDTGGPSGKDQPIGVAQFSYGCIGWADLSPDVQPADPIGDEMGVLTAEIKDDDAQRETPPGRGW